MRLPVLSVTSHPGWMGLLAGLFGVLALRLPLFERITPGQIPGAVTGEVIAWNHPALQMLGTGGQLQSLTGLRAEVRQLCTHPTAIQPFARVGDALFVDIRARVSQIGLVEGIQGTGKAIVVMGHGWSWLTRER